MTYERFEGLRQLAKTLRGDEVLHVGVRPFGFHAGNHLSLVIYPELLCEALEMSGKKAHLHLIVSINDWEQHLPSGIDPVRYPYNIRPADTIFQFTPGPGNASIVDYWEPRIWAAYEPLRRRFPAVQIEFRRNSALRNDRRIVPILRKTKSHALAIGEMFRRLGRYEVIVDDTLTFAEAVCLKCHTARGASRFLDDDNVEVLCEHCGTRSEGDALEFDWWLHHKPLFVARWHLWGFDVAVSGGDHFDDHDDLIRDDMRALFDIPSQDLRMLFAPLIVDYRGWKMSKSAHNEVNENHDVLLDRARHFDGRQLSIEEVDA